MKIVLTGGTGLIGNALGQALVKQGHELHVLVRTIESARHRLSYPCTLWPWQLGAAVPREAMSQAEIVIHLAGENVAAQRWTPERKRALRNSRIKITEALAAAVQSPLLAFISASGIGYFGNRGDEILNDMSAPGEDFLAKLCQEWEAVSETVPAARHLQMRLGVVLSPLGGFLSTVVPLFQIAGASRLGDGRQYFSWIHIDDAVRIFVEAVNNPDFSGPYNVVAPNPETNAQLTKNLREVLQARSGPPAPSFALKLMYGELAQALLGSQRASPRRLSATNFQFRFAELEGALKAIFPKLEAGEMQSAFELWVPGSRQQIWEFFSDERNLEKLTPPLLNFKVLNKSTPALGPGTLIDYHLKIRGVPARWQTRISEWEPESRFADEQLKGPYAKWYHVHEFEELGDGVLLRDTVRWRLPLGTLGRTAALAFVLKDIAQIFRFRSEAIDRIFCPR